MNTIRKRLPSPAMLVACVSLVVALGGVSYAAGVLPKGSVGTAQLQKKAVTASKLRQDAVSGAKVKDGTLLAADFQAGQLPAGTPGPQGPNGDKGDTGAAGAPGVSGVEYIQEASASIAPGGYGGAIATCPAGKTVLAGGGLTESDAPILESVPNGNDQWAVTVRNDGAGPTVLVTYAVCANVS